MGFAMEDGAAAARLVDKGRALELLEYLSADDEMSAENGSKGGVVTCPEDTMANQISRSCRRGEH